LITTATCVECIWESVYSDHQVNLDVQYTSWNEEYAQEDLQKQPEYAKEVTEVDGRSENTELAPNKFGRRGCAIVREFVFMDLIGSSWP
jgi:hypothetical protein